MVATTRYDRNSAAVDRCDVACQEKVQNVIR